MLSLAVKFFFWEREYLLIPMMIFYQEAGLGHSAHCMSCSAFYCLLLYCINYKCSTHDLYQFSTSSLATSSISLQFYQPCDTAIFLWASFAMLPLSVPQPQLCHSAGRLWVSCNCSKCSSNVSIYISAATYVLIFQIPLILHFPSNHYKFVVLPP